MDMCVCVWERERERERERVGLLSLTPYLLNARWDTYFQSLAFFTGGLIQCRFSAKGSPPLRASAQTDVTCLFGWLLSLPDCWLLESKNVCCYIIFWRSYIFPSGAILVINFRCPFLTLRHSYISWFWNLQLTWSVKGHYATLASGTFLGDFFRLGNVILRSTLLLSGQY